METAIDPRTDVIEKDDSHVRRHTGDMRRRRTMVQIENEHGHYAREEDEKEVGIAEQG